MAPGRKQAATILPPDPVSDADVARFDRLITEELSGDRAGDGIGTLNEKRMHRILKRYMKDDPACFEISMGGRYVADVFDGERIFEIQTGSLLPLGKKLEHYIENTAHPVTVVHPVAALRYLVWVDPADGCVSPRHLSPKKGTTLSILPELVYISEQLLSGRVELLLLFIEEDEFRFLNGKRSADKKKGSDRYERLPCKLLGQYTISSPEDVRALIPEELPELFTAAEFGKLTKLRGRDLYRALKALDLLGVTGITGTRGRAAERKLTGKI